MVPQLSLIINLVLSLKNDYLNFFIMVLSIFGLFFFMMYVLNKLFLSKPIVNKITSYECGFEPFGDSRAPVSVQFYVVALLFLLFDLELIFMFPWVLSLKYITFAGNFSMFLFLLAFVLGMWFEFKKGIFNFEEE